MRSLRASLAWGNKYSTFQSASILILWWTSRLLGLSKYLSILCWRCFFPERRIIAASLLSRSIVSWMATHDSEKGAIGAAASIYSEEDRKSLKRSTCECWQRTINTYEWDPLPACGATVLPDYVSPVSPPTENLTSNAFLQKRQCPQPIYWTVLLGLWPTVDHRVNDITSWAALCRLTNEQRGFEHSSRN